MPKPPSFKTFTQRLELALIRITEDPQQSAADKLVAAQRLLELLALDDRHKDRKYKETVAEDAIKLQELKAASAARRIAAAAAAKARKLAAQEKLKLEREKRKAEERRIREEHKKEQAKGGRPQPQPLPDTDNNALGV